MTEDNKEEEWSYLSIANIIMLLLLTIGVVYLLVKVYNYPSDLVKIIDGLKERSGSIVKN